MVQPAPGVARLGYSEGTSAPRAEPQAGLYWNGGDRSVRVGPDGHRAAQFWPSTALAQGL